MDWFFASGCSPPRLSTTQLPSATDRPVFPSGKDFHPSDGAYFQAHPPRHVVPGSAVWTFQRLTRWQCPCVPEGRYDRSLARSAWESVPQKNRPVGYGMIGRSLSASLPRHFVPGYDQAVPSGTKAIRLSKWLTIILACMG